MAVNDEVVDDLAMGYFVVVNVVVDDLATCLLVNDFALPPPSALVGIFRSSFRLV